MNKWKVLFLIMLTISVLTYGLLLPPILSNSRPDLFYSNIGFSKTEPVEPGDIDYLKDSDSDGLTDYDEINKYFTNPHEKDSDGDGNIDSNWDERFEFTRTFKAIVDLRQPYSLEDMNDFYQDARLLEIISKEVSRFEIILYPEAKEVIKPFIFDSQKNSESEYTINTYSKNLSEVSKNKIKHKVKNSKTELEALIKLQREFNALSYVDIRGQLGYSTDTPLQFQYYSREDGSMIKNYHGHPTLYTMDEILDRVYFAEGMFNNSSRGACSSSATIRGAIFRAGGLEERTVFTIPLFYTTPEDNTEITVDRIPSTSELGSWGMSDHFFNEVKIGDRWIRVDTDMIDTGIYAPYIKLLSLHDQSDYNWEIWDLEIYFQKRPYFYVSIKEQHPVY